MSKTIATETLALVMTGVTLLACESGPKAAVSSPVPQPPLAAPAPARGPTHLASLGPGGQRPLRNPEALVPPQCYTRTEGRHNPCYVCHQNPIEGEGRENRMSDGVLQGQYGFSELALTNQWRNLFVDRSAAVPRISDEAILSYVEEDNYTPLVAEMRRRSTFQGWKPDLENLQLGARAFDEQGFARDGSRWVAFNYLPMPSTFWPTNGSTDDVMLRLPEPFRVAAVGGPYVHDIYLANLSILEAAIKGLPRIGTLPLDERWVGADLNGDGALTTITQLERPARYVGAASQIEVHTFLYPRGTELLHTVRYLGVDSAGATRIPPRMKEVRYMLKHTLIPKFAVAGIYDDELQEKIEAEPPYFPDFRDKGLDNGFGWRLQGFIEAADGALRPNEYEETLYCMGCHSTIGTTIDHTFAFARKVDGPNGFGYINLRDMPDAPSWGETEGQIATYLRRVGGGSEFRNNEEMRARWFKPDGSLDDAKVASARDVYTLITPSRERALLLNKAYRLIVQEQSFLDGRDATLTPPANVYREIPSDIAPLTPEHRYAWDLRVAWPETALPQAPASDLVGGAVHPVAVSAPTKPLVTMRATPGTPD